MARIVELHPDDPQPRRVAEIVALIRQGGLIAYPTDSSYALGCHIGDKGAMDRIHKIRRTDKKHNFTLVCSDLSEISTYARFDNWAYRLLKSKTPGPYTFILEASREVPKRLQNPKRRTIGLRVPDHKVVQAILGALGEPIMSSTLILPGEVLPLSDPENIRLQLEHEVDLVIDGGVCGVDPSTVVSWVEERPQILRVGRGDPAPFL